MSDLTESGRIINPQNNVTDLYNHCVLSDFVDRHAPLIPRTLGLTSKLSHTSSIQGLPFFFNLTSLCTVRHPCHYGMASCTSLTILDLSAAFHAIDHTTRQIFLVLVAILGFPRAQCLKQSCLLCILLLCAKPRISNPIYTSFKIIIQDMAMCVSYVRLRLCFVPCALSAPCTFSMCS